MAIKNIRKKAARKSAKSGDSRGKAPRPAFKAPVFSVVAVGASAGGLKALTALLKALPSNTGMAFVLIQHLEPEHESALTLLLSKATKMPVIEVSEGLRVEPDHVYVIPPDKSMTIRDGALRLAPRAGTARPYHPIDEFASALAAEQQSAAIGVVLSGSGSDGTLGLKAIKGEGGVTFAQDPETAEWPTMPQSAIAAGVVDFILPPGRIAAELARIRRHPYICKAQEAAQEAPEGDALEKIFALLRTATGVDFALYKRATVSRRLARRMAVQKVTSLSKYAEVLKQDPGEARALADDIFIYVTSFFRDREYFQALRKVVFPKLRLKRPANEPIRVWVPGCSTGEEAYSIAMLLLEDLGENSNRVKIQIFGTDISEAVIERARAGVYSESAVAGVPPARIRRFFSKADHGYQINKSVRELCVFARHDLAKDPPFSRMDLISCRNVLIYMGPVLQKRVLSAFQYALKPGGFLFIGKSESISGYSDVFAPLDRAHRIFSRKPMGLMAHRYEFPTEAYERGPEHLPPPTEAPASVPDFARATEKILLERYAPPCLAIDPDLQIVHFQGDTSPYLAPSTGQPSFHLLKIVRPEFVVELRTAIYKAKREGTTVVRKGVRFQSDGKLNTVDLWVEPLKRLNGKKDDFLIVFRDLKPVETARPEPKGESRDARKYAKLEQELSSTREYLRSLITEHEAAQEERKAANEEILSGNEELQSTNEELETAKEELQSSNEELITLNEELQNRNAELGVLSNDLNNVLVGVEIPVLLLDNSLQIRRFTPTAGALLNLRETDVGRPFSDMASTLDGPDWDAMFSELATQAHPVEREVRDRRGHWYSLRMHPYRTSDNKIDGVILAFLDIDEIKRALEEAREARDYAQAIIETTQSALVVLDEELRVVSANRRFCEMSGMSAKDLEQQAFFELGRGLWDAPGLRKLITEIVAQRTHIEAFELEHELPGAGKRHFRLNARRMADKAGRQMILIAIADATAERNAGKALREAEQFGRTVLDSLPAHIAVIDRDGTLLRTNEGWTGFARENGNPPAASIGPGANYLQVCRKAAAEGAPGAQEALSGITEVVEGRRRYFQLEAACNSPTEPRWYVMSVTPLGGGQRGAVITHTDVTSRRLMELERERSDATVRILLESSNQSIIAVEQSGRIVLANAVTEKMFGYGPQELVGMRLDLLVPKESRGRHSEYHSSFFVHAEGRPMGIGVELKALRKDGTTFPVEIGLNVIDSPQGRLGVAFINDITERKRIEDLMRQRERELDTLLSNVPDAIVRFDRDVRHLYLNEKAERVTGIPRERMIGKTPGEAGVPEQVGDPVTRIVGEVFESGQPVTADLPYPSPGGVTYFESRFYPEFGEDGSVRSVLNVARDVTEQRRLDELVRQRERELDTVLNNAPDVIVRFDRDMRYTYVNRMAEKVTGFAPGTMLGKTPSEAGMPKPAIDVLTHAVHNVLETRQPSVGELAYPSPEGLTHWETRFVPEFGDDGVVNTVLNFGREVTEQKRLEEVAEASRKEIRALTSRLLHAHEEERRRVSRELHDGICQDLAALSFDMGGLAADAVTVDANRERLRTLQARIIKASEQARHLAYELHPSVLDDLGLVVSLRGLCDEFARKEDVAVEFTDGNLPDAISREVASGLYRITQEALQNIAKHAQANRVAVRLTDGEGSFRLSIRDDGVGFDPQTVQGKGGLGLVSMRERARLINGELSIQSSPGQGTRITLNVPLTGDHS